MLKWRIVLRLRRALAPLSVADAATLREAADELDAHWRADAAGGFRDSHGGAEYARISPAPRLRQMADKIDPVAELRLHETGPHWADPAGAVA